MFTTIPEFQFIGAAVTANATGATPIQATGVIALDTTILQPIPTAFTFDTADAANTLDTTTLPGIVKVAAL